MPGQDKKLIGQLSLGLGLLRDNVKEANKILESISTKKLNLDIIDDKTKAKLIDAAKAIKKEIESIGGNSTATNTSKALADGILKSFNSIQVKAKEMQPVITETFKTIANDALQMAKNQEQAANIVSTAWDKTGKKVVESKKALYDDKNNIIGYSPSTKVTTDDSTAKLLKISNAYKQLTTEQKANENVMRGMENEVQKVIEKYGLQGKAYETASTQANKYRTAAEQIIQTEIRARDSVDAAINKTTRARETERLAQAKIDSSNSNKNLEDQYRAKVKATEQSIKQAQATEKQGLAELKLYTQEKSQTAQYDQMAKSLAKITGEASLAMSSSNYGNNMMQRFQISGAYAIAAQSIYMLRAAVTDMIQTNRDFEVGLVDLQRILGDVSANELKAFGENAIQIAKDFGQPLKEVQAAYSALAAAGVQNKDDLNSMSKTITMGLNTSTIKSASEMTDLLTSSMKQMNISFADSEKVLDSWNYLGDKSIATTADFAQAVSKAGATSLSMGIDVAHLNGMVAVLSNSTGASGTQIGDALKSIESRMLRPETLEVLRKYGIETMADANHFKDFGAIITDVSTQLDKFGENTVQSTEILDALGGTMRKNWINLLARDYDQVDTKAQESAIESIGYSATKSAATMDTLDKKIMGFNNTIKELYIGVGNSGLTNQLKGFVDLGTWLAEGGSKIAGFLLTLGEVAIALKVISGTMSVLKGQSLTQVFDKMNLSGLQSAANAGGMTGVSFNSGTTSATVYGAAVKSLQKDILAKNITEAQSVAILGAVSEKMGLASMNTNTMAAAQGALRVQVAEGVITQEVMNAEMAKLTVTTNAATLANAEKKAADAALNEMNIATTASTKGLQLAMMGVTLGITAVLMIGIPLIKWLTEADERQQKLLQDGADLAKKYEEESKSVGGLVTQYAELSASGKTDSDTKKQLLEIQTQLVSSYGEEAKGLDLVNGKYEEQIDKLNKVAKGKAEEYIRENQKAYNGAEGALSNSSKYHVVSGYGDRVNEYAATLENTKNTKLGGNIELTINGTLGQRVKILGDILDKSKTISNKTAGEKITVGKVSEEYYKLNLELKNANDIVQKMAGANLIDQYSGQLGKMSTANADFKNSMANNDVNGAKKADDELTSLKVSMEKVLSKNPEIKKAFEDWVVGLDSTGIAAKEAGTKIVDTATQLEALTKSFDTSMESISGYNKLMDQYRTDGKFSAESVKEIIDKHQELAGYLNNEPLLYEKMSEALETEKDTANKAYGSMMMDSESYYASNIKGTDTIQKALGAYYKNLTVAQKNDLANSKSLAEAKLVVEKDLIKRQADSWDVYNKAVSDATDEMYEKTLSYGAVIAGNDPLKAAQAEKMVQNAKAVKSAYKDYSNIKNQVDSIDSSFDGITAKITAPGILDYGNKVADTTAKVTKENKALTAGNKQATNAIKDYTNAIKVLDNQMKLLSITLSKLNPNSQAYINGLDKEAVLIQKKIDLTKKSIIVNEANAKSMLALESASTKSFTSASSTSSGGGSYAGGYQGGKYAGLINQSGAKWGIDPNIIAGIIQTENSTWDPKLPSFDKLGLGLGQFGVKTAQWMGLKDRTDPAQTIDAMGKLLNTLLKDKGNMDDAIRAYNGSGSITYQYLAKVKKNTPGGGTKSAGITSVNGDSTTDGGSDKVLAEIESQRAALIELQEQLAAFAYQKFNIQLNMFDEKTNVIAKRINNYKNQMEISDDPVKQLGLSKEIQTQLNAELTIAHQKSVYMTKEIQSRKYTAQQSAEMNKNLLDILATEQDITLQIKQQAEATYSLRVSNITDINDKNTSANDDVLKIIEAASKYNVLADDHIGQMELLHQKEATYKDDITKDNSTLAELSKTTAKTAGEQKILDAAIKSTTESLRGHTTALLDTQQAEKDLAMSQITSLLEKQKSTAEITLKQQQENEKNSLSSSIYGGTGTAEENIKAYDKQNQAQQDAYQKQIDNLNLVNDAQTEIETRLANQNSLIEKQTALQNAQTNLTTQTLTKNSDGSFQFKYVADADAVKTAQDALNDQVKSNADWEKSTALKHATDSLNALKKSLADEKIAKDNDYNDKLAKLEKHQLVETNLLALHYSDMNALATSSLETLKATYGDNWSGIIAQLTKDVATAKALNDSLLLAQATGTLPASVHGGTTSSQGGSTSGGGYVVTVTDSNGHSQTQTLSDAEYNSTSTQSNLNGVKNIPGVTVTANKFKEGGESAKTGMHWLDGEVGRPERVLSSTQTKDFGQLVTYLPSALTSMESIMDKISLSNVNNNTGSVNQYTFTGDLSLPNITNDSGVKNLIDNFGILRNLAIQKV